MERWWELLQSSQYQDVQKRVWGQRPVHMLGDQDVLTALLTSKEFSEIPIYRLKRGKHILQFDGVYGYTIAERMRNLVGDGPVFIHSGAGKPWSEQWRSSPWLDLREYVKKVYLDLSPYTLSAVQFRHKLEGNTEWMDPHYSLSRTLRALGNGHPPLVGLPMAIFADVARILKYMRRSRPSNPSLSETDRLEATTKQ